MRLPPGFSGAGRVWLLPKKTMTKQELVEIIQIFLGLILGSLLDQFNSQGGEIFHADSVG